MKKIFTLAALITLAAPAAFGQSADGGSGGVMARGGGMDKTAIIYLDTSDDSGESKAVGKAVRQELERSRQLEPSYIDDNQKARLIAPVSLTKDGDNMTVAIELRSARKKVENNQVTCPIAKPANCGRDIVGAAEKFIRANKNR